MRDFVTTLYKFDELSDDAQQRAVDDYLRHNDFFWSDEWWQSLQEFCSVAPVKIDRLDFSLGHADCVWMGDRDVANLKGLRAWKWLHNNGWFDMARRNVAGDCTLTGFYGDCALFDPIARYEKDYMGVPDLDSLFYECAQSLAVEARSDYENTQSFDFVSDELREMDYEFTEDGAKF